MISEVVCILFWEILLVVCMVGLVMTVGVDGVVNKIRVTLYFGFQVMLVGSLGVSDPCTL